MKKYLFIFLIFASCKTGNPQKEVVQTVQDFLGWYEANYQHANSFGLVNQGDSIVYSINFKETEKYLAYLKTSGFVSDAFLENFRTYFREADAVLKKDPVNEGPPPGFDFDIILYTQEPELVFEKRSNPVILSNEIKTDTAILLLDAGMKLQFSLSKKDGKWVIDQITYPEN